MILLLLITYHFLHCEPLFSLIAAIGAVIGIGFIFAAIFVMYKVWKPKHQHASVSERVTFDGHRGGDESYVMIDLHNVSHLT